MTIEKARKILGKYGVSLSDNDVQAIIDNFNVIIEVGIRQFEKRFKKSLVGNGGDGKMEKSI